MFERTAICLDVLLFTACGLARAQDDKKEFTPSGSFDNAGTKTGVVTGYTQDATTKEKKLNKEVEKPTGVELEYRVAASTPECTQIATIQIMWLTDDKGAVQSWKNYPGQPGDDTARQDKIAANGYWLDGGPKDKTPYYQDNGNGGFSDDMIGSSDGKGGGKPAHTTDKAQALAAGWTKHFETWTVCIAGPAAGTVLAGIIWEVGPQTTKDPNGKSNITDKAPKAPTQHFKDALKAWENWYNTGPPVPTPTYSEPGGGFKF